MVALECKHYNRKGALNTSIDNRCKYTMSNNNYTDITSKSPIAVTQANRFSSASFLISLSKLTDNKLFSPQITQHGKVMSFLQRAMCYMYFEMRILHTHVSLKSQAWAAGR